MTICENIRGNFMRILVKVLFAIFLIACSKNEPSVKASEQANLLVSNANIIDSSVSTVSAQPASAPSDLTNKTLASSGKTSTSLIPEEVEKYVRELDAINRNPNANEGVEGLLQLGRKASGALFLRIKEGTSDVLEDLSEEDFQKVSRKMKGFMVNREETLNVDPIPDFFLALAKRSSDQASVDFFEAYSKTKPGGGWAVYTEQQTDYGGCIRFGSRNLVNTYELWDAYKNKYPTRYTDEVRNIIHDVEFSLEDATCACGDKKSAILEFETFIRAFPNSKSSTRLRERINQITQGKSNLREHCISG
jgi:hypothetical protein